MFTPEEINKREAILRIVQQGKTDRVNILPSDRELFGLEKAGEYQIPSNPKLRCYSKYWKRVGPVYQTRVKRSPIQFGVKKDDGEYFNDTLDKLRRAMEKNRFKREVLDYDPSEAFRREQEGDGGGGVM